MTTFVALGDSITLGIGDPGPARGPGQPAAGQGPRAGEAGRSCWRTAWSSRELHIVAGNGACMADLERDQLPRRSSCGRMSPAW